METKFAPSTNILRDFDKNINYLKTDNAKKIYSQIVHDYNSGVHCFNIIGSYGTGKSTFLVAFEQTLRGKENYLGILNGEFGNKKEIDFLNIVGDFNSIIEAFGKELKIKDGLFTTDLIFKELTKKYHKLEKKNAHYVIVIDELGKFLEFASKNNPEKELYFIQQLAEFVNSPTKDILLLTTLHQGFDSYAHELEQTQRHEWEKVKGRLKEITFNEPVEHLLELAANYLSQQKKQTFELNGKFKSLIELIENSKTFPHSKELNEEFLKRLYPLEPVSASILTFTLQKYGQNERSLFTFLYSKDYESKQDSFYGIPDVYDYLIDNFYSYLSTKYNSDYAQWSAIRKASEKVEGFLSKNHNEAFLIVKTIGLLNIFAKNYSKIDEDFLVGYGKFCLGIENPKAILRELEKERIIRFIYHKQSYILFDGTDLDIEAELIRAEKKVDVISDVSFALKKYFEFPTLLAKAVTYKKGTPRFFKFEVTNIPTEAKPVGEFDGIINLIFSETTSVEGIQNKSSANQEAVLFGYFSNSKEIRNTLTEIEKINFVKSENQNDKVAITYLDEFKESLKEELNQLVLEKLYSKNESVKWFFQGKKIKINSHKKFNQTLSKICEKVYSKTPVFRNELINKHKISGAISSAKKNYLKNLISNFEKEDLGFTKDKFPPEKTIYLSLLKKTGMHILDNSGFKFGKPKDSFTPLWEVTNKFFEDAKTSPKKLEELIEILSEKPFKLKGGFIEFWVASILFIKRNDYALYQDEKYVPNLDIHTFNLIGKAPKKFKIKSFNVEGVRLEIFNNYRKLIQKSEQESFTNENFIETIKPFLVFYRNLDSYTKRTKNLSTSALRLREAISKAKEPEKTFFEDFPKALGYSNLSLQNLDEEGLKLYSDNLNSGIQELRNCFGELINRVENNLLSSLNFEKKGFSEYRAEIKNRFNVVNKDLLLEHQKSFYKLIFSNLDERTSWISSVVQVILKKDIKSIRDEEESLLFTRLKNTIKELENLIEVRKVKSKNEEVLKLEITTSNNENINRTFPITKNQLEKSKKLSEKIEAILSESDEEIKLSVLTLLLKKELKNNG